MRKAILILMLAAAPLAGQEWQTKIVHLRHRSAQSMAELLRNISKFNALSNREFNTVTLNGAPESIKTAEAIIEQYDTPARQAELIFRVIEASSAPEGPNDAADLVPAELKTLLRYSRYKRLDSAIVRGVEGSHLRTTMAGNLRVDFEFRVRPESKPPLIDLNLSVSGPPSSLGEKITQLPALLETSAALKDGETVVLGASKMREGANALIVLVTGKLLP